MVEKLCQVLLHQSVLMALVDAISYLVASLRRPHPLVAVPIDSGVADISCFGWCHQLLLWWLSCGHSCRRGGGGGWWRHAGGGYSLVGEGP